VIAFSPGDQFQLRMDTEQDANMIRPILDQLANAAGTLGSPVFDASTAFMPFRRR